jgi:hypothetical protein
MSATRECRSCRKEVSSDAAKCPHCGEWREDIKRERNLCYLWSFVSLLPIIVIFIGSQQRWWPPPERTTEVLGVRMPSLNFSTFDWGTLFSSPSGLFLIAAFGVTFGICLHYYISLSRKMDNWIWV